MGKGTDAALFLAIGVGILVLGIIAWCAFQELPALLSSIKEAVCQCK